MRCVTAAQTATAGPSEFNELAERFAIVRAKADLYPISIAEAERARILAHGQYVGTQMLELYQIRDNKETDEEAKKAAIRELQMLDNAVRSYQQAAGQRVTGEPSEVNYDAAARVMAEAAQQEAARSVAHIR